jgi:hypothetical protein
MAKQQQPFGGGPRLGNAAPGEPAPTPNAADQAVFGGGPAINGVMNRGSRVVGPNPSSEIFPAPYGGGPSLEKRPNVKPAKGSGDGTGAGATSGSSQHSGAGIP